MKRNHARTVTKWNSIIVVGVVVTISAPGLSWAQVAPYVTKWMAAGSLHNWYANTGSEIEEGRIKSGGQDGMRWSAYYKNQDMQVAKALWIGTTDFTEADGTFYPHKVVHCGPRVDGRSELFPVKFTQYLRFPSLPEVYVDGALLLGTEMAIDSIDETMVPDVMIENVVNSAIGITMTRRIMQFSQQYHDNYIVSEYTFTNTGNTDADPEIERPDSTLTGVYFYFQYRLAICADTRFVIGIATGWGINTILDVRGDGVRNDQDDAVEIPGLYNSPHMRIQYAWHGWHPYFYPYDNIGGPIWTPFYDPADTVGRLGASQFVGVVTLHADASTTDPTDDFNQPMTTSYEGSDEPFTSNNSQFNGPVMTGEYTQWMTRGHRAPRHADVVEPSGNFSEPTGDPALGTPGGFSNANGYGPYTLGPGQSVRIVWAEGAAGLSRERQISIGRRFKAGEITAKDKNDSVFTSRDSLFQTFRRAIANYKSGYAIPRPPLPPKEFHVASGPQSNTVAWTVHEPVSPHLVGFRIYRAEGRPDNPEYTLIHAAGPSERSFVDSTMRIGVQYYYYIQSVGSAASNTGIGLTPPGELVSNRVFTQTTEAAVTGVEVSLKDVPAGFSLSQNYPNPFNPRTTIEFALPHAGYVTLRVYNVLGEEIAALANGQHDAGNSNATWDASGLPSGVYFYRLTAGEYVQTRKMVLMK